MYIYVHNVEMKHLFTPFWRHRYIYGNWSFVKPRHRKLCLELVSGEPGPKLNHSDPCGEGQWWGVLEGVVRDVDPVLRSGVTQSVSWSHLGKQPRLTGQGGWRMGQTGERGGTYCYGFVFQWLWEIAQAFLCMWWHVTMQKGMCNIISNRIHDCWFRIACAWVSGVWLWWVSISRESEGGWS